MPRIVPVARLEKVPEETQSPLKASMSPSLASSTERIGGPMPQTGAPLAQPPRLQRLPTDASSGVGASRVEFEVLSSNTMAVGGGGDSIPAAPGLSSDLAPLGTEAPHAGTSTEALGGGWDRSNRLADYSNNPTLTGLGRPAGAGVNKEGAVAVPTHAESAPRQGKGFSFFRGMFGKLRKEPDESTPTTARPQVQPEPGNHLATDQPDAGIGCRSRLSDENPFGVSSLAQVKELRGPNRGDMLRMPSITSPSMRRNSMGRNSMGRGSPVDTALVFPGLAQVNLSPINVATGRMRSHSLDVQVAKPSLMARPRQNSMARGHTFLDQQMLSPPALAGARRGSPSAVALGMKPIQPRALTGDLAPRGGRTMRRGPEASADSVSLRRRPGPFAPSAPPADSATGRHSRHSQGGGASVHSRASAVSGRRSGEASSPPRRSLERAILARDPAMPLAGPPQVPAPERRSLESALREPRAASESGGPAAPAPPEIMSRLGSNRQEPRSGRSSFARQRQSVDSLGAIHRTESVPRRGVPAGAAEKRKSNCESRGPGTGAVYVDLTQEGRSVRPRGEKDLQKTASGRRVPGRTSQDGMLRGAAQMAARTGSLLGRSGGRAAHAKNESGSGETPGCRRFSEEGGRAPRAERSRRREMAVLGRHATIAPGMMASARANRKKRLGLLASHFPRGEPFSEMPDRKPGDDVAQDLRLGTMMENLRRASLTRDSGNRRSSELLLPAPMLQHVEEMKNKVFAPAGVQ